VPPYASGSLAQQPLHERFPLGPVQGNADISTAPHGTTSILNSCPASSVVAIPPFSHFFATVSRLAVLLRCRTQPGPQDIGATHRPSGPPPRAARRRAGGGGRLPRPPRQPQTRQLPPPAVHDRQQRRPAARRPGRPLPRAAAGPARPAAHGRRRRRRPGRLP